MADAVSPATVDGLAGPQETSVPGEGLPHPPIQPLLAVGVVVTKAALIDALRLYVPQLLDVEPMDDGHFFLRTASDGVRAAGGQ